MTADTTAAAPSGVAAPAGRLVGRFEPGTPGWTEARSGCITATRIAAVLGLSPWESPFSLWHRMAGTVSDKVEVSPEMEWGTRLEDAVAQKFYEGHEYCVESTGTWANVDRPWQRATPDRLLSRRGRLVALLELKTSPMGDGWGDDSVPVYYEAQVQWQLDTLGVDVCYVAVLISGHDYREYEIHADPDAQAFMRERAKDFLESLAVGEAPKIDGHDRTYQTVKQLPDGVDDVAVDIGPALADQYRDAQDAMKAAKDGLNTARSLILDRLGNGLRAESLRELIAYRTTKPDGSTHALMPARGQNRKTS
jgi:putative phage-type endonuclease